MIQLIHFLTKINVNVIATLYQLTAQIQTSLTFYLKNVIVAAL